MFCQSLSHILNCSKKGWLRHCTVGWMQEQFNARQRCHKCLGQIKGHTLNFSRWQNTLESRLLLWLQSHKRHVQRQKSPRPSFMRRPILRPDNLHLGPNQINGIDSCIWTKLLYCSISTWAQIWLQENKLHLDTILTWAQTKVMLVLDAFGLILILRG